MDEKAVVEFISQDKKIHVDLEIQMIFLTVIWQQRIQLYSYVEIKHWKNLEFETVHILFIGETKDGISIQSNYQQQNSV